VGTIVKNLSLTKGIFEINDMTKDIQKWHKNLTYASLMSMQKLLLLILVRLSSKIRNYISNTMPNIMANEKKNHTWLF